MAEVVKKVSGAEPATIESSFRAKVKHVLLLLIV